MEWFWGTNLEDGTAPVYTIKWDGPGSVYTTLAKTEPVFQLFV